MNFPDEGEYTCTNIRELLGGLIGKRVLEITQQDPGEDGHITLMFEDGSTLMFFINDKGFIYTFDG